MSASVWNPNTAVSANLSVRTQSFTATALQTDFVLTAFAYAVGTNSLQIYVDGLAQRLTLDFSELTTTTFRLLTGVPVGTIVYAVGLVEITSTSVVDPNAARKGVNSDIVELTGLTVPLTRGQGGTGVIATTTANLLALLGAAASGVNADITSAAALTTTPALIALPQVTSGSVFRKNAVINGDFQVWQEGTSFVAMADGTYIADNWRYNKVGAMVHTGSRSTDVPTIVQAGRKIPYSILIDCTTVDAAIAAADYTILSTFVEGYNFVNIAGVGLCHQFWHKHTKVGTYCVSYSNAGSDRSFVREYTQAVSDTWQQSTVLVDASPTAGTWDYTNSIGLTARFALAAGTTFQTTAGAWQTGNFFATANQVNASDNVANNFMLAGVQLEKGSVATEFDVRTFNEEEMLCKRYWTQSYNPGSSGGTVSTSDSIQAYAVADSLTVTLTMPVAFAVQMRASPTVTIYSPDTGTAARIRDVTGAADVASVAFGISVNGFAAISQNAGFVGNDLARVHYTANARF